MVWNKIELENKPHPKYLGVTLDRTLGYKQHIHNTKMKVATRNNLLRNLSNSKMGSECRYNQNNNIVIKLLCGRIRGTCLGEITSRPETQYGTKQCMQSRHRMPETNNVEDLYLLAGIAPPDICMC